MNTMTEPNATNEGATATEIDPVSTCRTLSIFMFLLLVAAGGAAANFGHVRTSELGVDMTTFGIWAGAGAICLVVGVCSAAICRQLRMLLRP